jgi:hypothetical protein
VFCALGEALGDDLSVEGVGEHLRPVFEGAVGGDAGGAAVVVALADDLKGELCLSGIHLEGCEVVDDEQLGANILAQRFLEPAVELGAMELVEHLGRGDEHDAASCLTGLEGQRASEEGLAGAGDSDEERVDSLVEEAEVVQREIASANLLSAGIEVEVETVDGIDLGEARVPHAALDGALQAAGLLLVSEAVSNLESGEVFGATSPRERRAPLSLATAGSRHDRWLEMAWVEHWRALSLRIQALLRAGELFTTMLEAAGRVDHFNIVGRAFLPELSSLTEELRIFREANAEGLPVAARKSLDDYLARDAIGGVNAGQLQALVPLALLQSQFDYAIRDTEIVGRSLVELAFEHLRRSIVVNPHIAESWTAALAHETQCEQLGAVHLLAHGIWAFKVNATGGATDLVFPEPLSKELDRVHRTANTIVLTEWKVVRDGDNPAAKAVEARLQTKSYSSGVLGTLELKRTRYIVLVVATQAEEPADVIEDSIRYRHVVLSVQSQCAIQAR